MEIKLLLTLYDMILKCPQKETIRAKEKNEFYEFEGHFLILKKQDIYIRIVLNL